tara:strand:+ start:135 stop:596 length:462 start_codon:yes stop_codon:yes gene_type:complete
MIITSAVMVVISSQLIHSAVSLLFTLFGVAGLYVFLYADFMAATQVIIYVGGILVLIIFGVMLTNKIDTPSIVSSSTNQVVGFMAASFLLLLQLAVIFKTEWPQQEFNESWNSGSTAKIGNLLLQDYLLAFEVVSILLLAALIGAAFLSRRNS